MSKRAVVFAGQGAQYVGMGKDLAADFAECRALFDRASEVLGYDLAKICFEGPEEELTRTDRCQPAIFVTSIACLTALQMKEPSFDAVATAGLSLGEWSALHMAGALSFEDTVRVLEARGRFMQEACDETDGGMVSIIGLSDEDIERIKTKAGVEISNLNSPGQTVLSGPREKTVKAAELAKEAGAKRALPLKVAGAYHSSLMKSAAEKLREALDDTDICEPSLPVISNVTGEPHGDVGDIKRNMVLQVTSTVRWTAGIQHLCGEGVGEIVECGPGRVLSGLIKRIDGTVALCNVQDIPTLEKAVCELGQ